MSSGGPAVVTGSGHRRGGPWATVLLLLLVIAVLVIPALLADWLRVPDPAASVGLAGLSAMLATYTLGWRLGLAVTAVLALGVPLTSLASGNAVGACLVMALVGIAVGLSSLRDWQRSLMLVPITLGFVVTAPLPASELTGADLAALGALTGVSALAAVGLVRLLPTGQHRPGDGTISRLRALGFTVMLALAATLTTAIAVAGQWGHAGGWLIMTPFIVLQPDLHSALHKSTKRAFGTMVGFVIAFVIALVVSHGWVVYALGIVFAALAVEAVRRHWDYWAYAAALTVAIVLIEGAGTSITQTSVLRLAATILGVLICLGIIALLVPIYERAERHSRAEETTGSTAEVPEP